MLSLSPRRHVMPELRKRLSYISSAISDAECSLYGS